ncbi:MAG: anion transporter [Gammaproteobacteria bacterium]|nr:anion transporter [Gammaproteobacteria bacterium]HJL95763.1 DASS family sodium-coupled anion symporter [SAR86 cluster bacterium]|tara:strand:- start:5053 stop:6489 length:1437 start_codon:yes stop_codon:yes gene_type:complete
MSLLKENFGFLLGVIAATLVILLPSPDGLSTEGHKTAALFLLMGIWWATEAVPVAVTALVPLALFPILGIVDIQSAANPYANKTIYLFFGGFLIATAIQKWDLHKRIALFVLEYAGSNGASLIFGFMLTAALISMWVMNTATTIMLLPIGLAVITVVKETVKGLSEQEMESFQLALLLGIAYGATIGGMSTLIGTGPNGMLAAFMADNYSLDISFVDWMKVGVPLSAFMLPCSWLILTRIIFKVEFETSQETRNLLSTMKNELGTLDGPEFKVFVVFVLTALAWMFRTVLDDFSFLNGLSDAGIAMISALFLFLLPSGKKGALLEWKDAQENVPWGLLVLFGGGLSLANAVQTTGLAVWMGNLIPQGISIALIVILVVTMIIFLTELTSNMATTATFLPVVAAIAVQSNFNPLLVTAAVALAASCAFMLPVATPPNAIVFGSGLIKVPQMAKAGLLINILGILVVSMVAVLSVPYFLL